MRSVAFVSLCVPVCLSWSGCKKASTYIHCEPKQHTKIFCHIFHKIPVDSDKIWYALSRINLRYSSLNVFQFTWTMSLHYLVKLKRSRFVSEQQLELRTSKHTKCFCHIVYKTRPIRIKFYTYCPEYICHRIL